MTPCRFGEPRQRPMYLDGLYGTAPQVQSIRASADIALWPRAVFLLKSRLTVMQSILEELLQDTLCVSILAFPRLFRMSRPERSTRLPSNSDAMRTSRLTSSARVQAVAAHTLRFCQVGDVIGCRVYIRSDSSKPFSRALHCLESTDLEDFDRVVWLIPNVRTLFMYSQAFKASTEPTSLFYLR